MEEDCETVQSSCSKKELSNAKRLVSIKQRSQRMSSQQKLISEALRNLDAPQNKKIVFLSDDEEEKKPIQNVQASNSKVKNLEKERLALFESSGSEDENEEIDDQKRFRSKPQFEGHGGEQLFQLSSQFADERFKLDERFAENGDKEDESDEDVQMVDEDELQSKILVDPSEKEKNLDLLSKVLGFQVPKSSDWGKSSTQKYLRFDPESENAADYIKKSEVTEEPKSKKSRPNKSSKSVEEQTPVVTSKERYFEVSEDLKDFINHSATPFSFAQRFGLESSEDEPLSHKQGTSISAYDSVENKSAHSNKGSTLVDTEATDEMPRNHRTERTKPIETKSSHFEPVNRRTTMPAFFIKPGDPRLAEGVKFFRRTKTMEELRKNWSGVKEVAVEMYKKNRRLALKAAKNNRSNKNFGGQFSRRAPFKRKHHN